MDMYEAAIADRKAGPLRYRTPKKQDHAQPKPQHKVYGTHPGVDASIPVGDRDSDPDSDDNRLPDGSQED
jgi:hypothetical protein